MNKSTKEIEGALKDGTVTVSVIGLGRIGLPTATLFANAGANVIGVDINKQVIKDVSAGICRFNDEPELGQLLKKVVSSGKLRADSYRPSSISESDMIIICAPTPLDDKKLPNCEGMRKLCVEIGKSIRQNALVVVESTVSPGFVEDTLVPLIEESSRMKAGRDFGVASCPERAIPGQTVSSMRSFRRVIGGFDQKSTMIASDVYHLVLGVEIVPASNPKTANAIKLTENIYRDVNIALMSEFALLYEKLGIDIFEVVRGCSSKIGFVPHFPGVGVGGPCLPANAYYIVERGLRVGYVPRLILTARKVNDEMADHVVALAAESISNAGKLVNKSKVALLGVSYKADIHDLQMTPLKNVYEILTQIAASVSIYDPLFKGEEVFGIRASETLSDALEAADCVVIGAAHKEFLKLDLREILKLCNNPASIVDTQNIIDPYEAKKLGFSYLGVGRGLNGRSQIR